MEAYDAEPRRTAQMCLERRPSYSGERFSGPLGGLRPRTVRVPW